MIDTYTKAVLTVIAVALVALVVRPMFQAAPAGAQVIGCGLPRQPCYVTTGAGEPLLVTIQR